MKRSLTILLAALTIGCAADEPPSAESARVSTPDAAPTRSWPADSAFDPFASEATRAAIPVCAGSARITSDSLGPVAIGATLQQLEARCTQLSRYFEPTEGVYYPALAMRAGGAAVSIELDGDSAGAPITRVSTADSAARTEGGVGPGSLVSAVDAAHGPLRFDDAECALYAWSDRFPGVSWAVEYPSEWDCLKVASVGDPGGATLPDSARVRSVFVRERQ